MIPKLFIERWRENVNWQNVEQVEQDMIISRALICLYNNTDIANSLVFRGGAALNKLFIKPPSRYSEDLDFVQMRTKPVGPTLDIIRGLLNPWLGKPKWKITEHSGKLLYRYEDLHGAAGKLKIEINLVENFQVLPLKHEPFAIESKWFSGSSAIYYI